MAYSSRHTGAEIDKAADLSGIFHVAGSGSSAAVTSGTTQRAQWKGSCKDKNFANLITALTDGLSITYRPDVAGDYSRGVTLNINNLGEHPVVINTSGATIGTRCAIGNTILLTYNSTKTASVIVSGTNTSFTGVWQVVNFDGGNASTANYASSADSATKDGSGNVIASTYSKTTHTHSSTDIKPPAYTTGSGMPNLYETYIPNLRANRLAFMPPESIYIETSTDGGTTWTPVSFPDNCKTLLFSKIDNMSLELPKASSGKKSCSCLLRITFTAIRFKTNSSDTDYSNNPSDWIVSKYYTTERYCSLEHMYIWCNSNTDRIYCKVEKATGANPTSWVADGEGYISGWTGGNYIKLSGGYFGGYNSQTSNYWHRRITFRTCTTQNNFNDSDLTTGTYETWTQSVSCIFSCGRNCWDAPNNLMSFDRLYDYDSDKNATFPGKISCSTPTSDDNVTTKSYVDNKISTAIEDAINDTLGDSY